MLTILPVEDLILQRLPLAKATTLRASNGQAEADLNFSMMAGAFNEYKIASYLRELAKALGDTN
jgi:hypothetical protein